MLAVYRLALGMVECRISSVSPGFSRNERVFLRRRGLARGKITGGGRRVFALHFARNNGEYEKGTRHGLRRLW